MNVPVLIVLTTIVIVSDFPLSKTGIIVVKLPLTNLNPFVSRISQTVILVASEGPLLVTIILA